MYIVENLDYIDAKIARHMSESVNTEVPISEILKSIRSRAEVGLRQYRGNIGPESVAELQKRGFEIFHAFDEEKGVLVTGVRW